MSPARTPKSTTMSDAESRRRDTIVGVLRAIRDGRLRVVHPHPTGPFRPRMDVYDDPDSPTIVATFELPGVVKRDDVSISAKDGALIVQGQRLPRYRSSTRTHPSLHGRPQPEATDMDVDSDANARFFPFQELRYGSFARRLQLPLGANTRHTTASLSDGLLTVSWPRSPPGNQPGDFSILV
ncbi:hypothetical protein C8J57DRAFT_1580641 [Mycena rebaudengoi]|nr:hypothetical protein C8J57DRAFT_1580641 [Mycena rebaudengoi]